MMPWAGKKSSEPRLYNFLLLALQSLHKLEEQECMFQKLSEKSLAPLWMVQGETRLAFHLHHCPQLQ
jgi:aminoglycoside phosphotransferase